MEFTFKSIKKRKIKESSLLLNQLFRLINNNICYYSNTSIIVIILFVESFIKLKINDYLLVDNDIYILL